MTAADEMADWRARNLPHWVPCPCESRRPIRRLPECPVHLSEAEMAEMRRALRARFASLRDR